MSEVSTARTGGSVGARATGRRAGALAAAGARDHQGMQRADRARLGGLGWGWAALGGAGSVVMAVAGPGLVDRRTIVWWYTVRLPAGHAGAMTVFYVGMAALVAAWLGVGARLRHADGARPGHLLAVGALWCVPLLAGPALFSGDSYSYLAQGMILHLGLSPYHDVPLVLARHGQAHLLAAVSPFWRGTTAPYGPLFLGISSVIEGAVGGTDLVLGVVLQRLVELAGVVLVAVSVPRLARGLGTDPCIATWLAVLSPLVLLELLAAGHNDALMTGLMVAGVTLALERRPMLAIALCALGATVKAPSAVAVAFVALSWMREQPSRSARIRVLLVSGAVALGVFAAVSAATGIGLAWLTPAVLSAPSKVHLAVTPSTALGYTVGHVLAGLGAGMHTKALEAGFAALSLALTAVVVLVLLWRVRRESLVASLAAVLLVSAFFGPATWPWYLTWGLALAATLPAAQRSRLLAGAVALLAVEVKPDGILALPRESAPAVLLVYLLVAVTAWRLAGRSARVEVAASREAQQR